MRDASGDVVPELRDAVDRGVVLDIGHSGTDFRFREARALFERGIFPHTASTDLNVFNVDGPVFSITETLTKLLALGLHLNDVIATATVNAAKAINRDHELGVLALGRRAEVSVLRLRTDGPFPVTDGHEVVTSAVALEPVGCVRAGVWVPVPEPVPSYSSRGWTARAENDGEEASR
jgi:dihydroorotase